jgi:FkbM family methyltransferase
MFDRWRRARPSHITLDLVGSPELDLPIDRITDPTPKPSAIVVTSPGPNILTDQVRIMGSKPKLIFDVGSQNGATTIEYLNAFPSAQVVAFEPEPDNWLTARDALASYADRCVILKSALSDKDGTANFHINSHNGTHSVLPIGDIRFWASPETEVRIISVQTRSLDSIASERAIQSIDIVKMDIQGGELAALKGATNLLADKAISLLALEVEFQFLYQGQPLFWDIAGYLRQFGYSFYKLYEPFYNPKNPNILCWGDAIFLSPEMLR